MFIVGTRMPVRNFIKPLALGLTFALAVGVAGTPVLQAQDDGAIEYTFEAGDTLYGLAEDYFVSSAAAGRVQRLNGIANARRIPVGAVITVPRSLLKSDPVSLRVRFFSGDVSIERRGQTSAPQVGQTIAPGSTISTQARAFISLQGEGSTSVSLPSNSRVRINRARRYRIDNSLDVDLRVLRGRGEITAPKLREGERFRTGTPLAVTAVRGTQFRVAYNEDDAQALTEVVEGLVEISADGAAVSAAEGQGVASDTAGLGAVEDLLAAPEVIEPGAIQTDEDVTFTLVPSEGAVAYRTQIARDVTFFEVIAEGVSDEPSVQFADIPDGRLSMRTRGIAENGLEGLAQDANFRRKRVGASAGLEPSPFADAFKFAWLPEGEGQSYAAFQLWRKGAPETLIVDEVGIEAPGLYISDIAPGDYMWRLATFVIDEGDVIKVWGEPQELTVTE